MAVKTSLKGTLSVRKNKVEKTPEVKAEKALKVKPKVLKKKSSKPEISCKRDRRQAKIKAKNHADVVFQLLPKFEQIRKPDVEKDKKFEIVQQMMQLCKKFLAELCLAHDTSRIIEAMIQYGTERHRIEIFAGIKSQFTFLCKSKHAKFVILKLINYLGKEQIGDMITIVCGRVAKMLVHKNSAEIIELLYNEHAGSKQRSLMMQELYGSKYILDFVSNKISKLADVFVVHPDKKITLLKHINETLITMISKNLMNHSIIQRLLLEYLVSEIPLLHNMYPPNEKAKISPGEYKISDRVQTILDAVVEHSQLVPMLHTREGVRIALCLMWISPPKMKKQLLKTLKTCVCSISCNEHGNIFIMSLFDSVDDMVLLNKTIIKEIIEDLETVVIHPHGRKTLMYALSPRDTTRFSKQLLADLIEPVDNLSSTKKNLAVRSLELKSVSAGLLPALLRLANEKLVEVFVGDRVENLSPLHDRDRLILLAMIITRSNPYYLELENVASEYKRTVDNDLPSFKLPESDLNLVAQLRSQLLQKFVVNVLSQEFIPSGKQLPSLDKEMKEKLQHTRRKRALVVAEEFNVKQRKIKVDPFTNVAEKSEKMEVDEEESEKKKLSLYKEIEDTLAEMPWLERPEGSYVVGLLFAECKRTKDYQLFDTIIEQVPDKVLRSWISCNRTCFLLVKLIESGYDGMVKHLKSVFSGSKVIKTLTESNITAAEILLKKLK